MKISLQKSSTWLGCLGCRALNPNLLQVEGDLQKEARYINLSLLVPQRPEASVCRFRVLGTASIVRSRAAAMQRASFGKQVCSARGFNTEDALKLTPGLVLNVSNEVRACSYRFICFLKTKADRDNDRESERDWPLLA